MTLTGPLSTVPPSLTMATTEELPLGFDTSPLLAVGQSPSAPSTVLTNLTTDAVIALPDPPTINGNVITQIVPGDLLAAGAKFVLSVTFTAAVDTTWTMVLAIIVPF